MRRIVNPAIGILLIFCSVGIDFAQQITIERIEQMPNQPSPYEMRDWKRVTLGYDSLVFDFDRQGEYLPLISWMTNTLNYPNHQSFRLHTVVGTSSPLSSEAINVIPAVIGASLAGINKSNQNGHNWVLYCEEFFNKRPEENVYLNHPVSQSGDDWWYATMPNIFFYQLYSLYPQTGDFDFQFTSVADQWLTAVKIMGGQAAPWHLPDMNYRGWYLSTMTPYDEGVRQPEAAGAIAWLLYNCYHVTGQAKYRIGAEWSLEFLNNWSSNPAYELQLPYGAYIAARMNAELGTGYDIERIVNWCFDVGSLRNWGAILGHWGVYDVHGLIGEADGTDYAFIMNTFEQIGALVPLVRYDDRFARAIGKWVLNAANACRLFYPNYLTDLYQDSEEWAHVYDPESYIAHEAMRQTQNGFPFATGDAIEGDWGATNLVLYGSSHVGILGGIIDTTNVEKILKLDLLKTDYFHQTAYPSYLYFNPYPEEKNVDVPTGDGNHDIYDAVSNQIINMNVNGNIPISIPSDEARLVVILPAGGSVIYELDRMLVNGVIADYRSGQSVVNYPPRIKALAVDHEPVILNDSVSVFCTAEDKDNDVLTYVWQADEGQLTGSGAQVEWTAPSSAGNARIFCQVEDGNGHLDSTSIIIQATEHINTKPLITGMTAQPRKIDLGKETTIYCFAFDPENDRLTYTWSAKSGNLSQSDSIAVWTAPDLKGDYFIVCHVEDEYNASVTDSIVIAVRDLSIIETGDLVAYYPFNGNATDASGFSNDGTVNGAVLSADRFAVTNNAYYFDGLDDFILVPNVAHLNFQNSISVNFWLRVNEFFDSREAYPLSHGNWERRWKFSIFNKKIRWTIKTDTQIKDVDFTGELALNTFYNITGCYNGSDIELYINGQLDNFAQLNGKIMTTTVDLTIGQVLPNNNQYNFKGVLDDIRIYNYALSMQEIANLYDTNLQIAADRYLTAPLANHLEQNYPNPLNSSTRINYNLRITSEVDLSIYNILGQKMLTLVKEQQGPGNYSMQWNAYGYPSGIYYYRLETSRGFVQTRKLLLLK
jgi:hypothetical protein